MNNILYRRKKDKYMELENGRYRHYKGHMYEVFMTAQHSDTKEWMV